MRFLGLFVLAAAFTLVPLAAGAGPNRGAIPGLTQVSEDRVVDTIGYHASEEEPSIASSGQTIVATQQVGRVFDGGASAIGWETSTNGGRTWSHGLIPLTIQSGQATTDAGPLTRASDTVVAYNAKFHTWLISTLGLAGNADVPAIYVNLSPDGINWSAPIVTHLRAATADSPDKNWITCDNWPTSKGYGNCYEEKYDNNGNGNRLLMQVSTDGGHTWSATANTPPNGNSGDVANQTTLAAAATSGDTNIKVTTITGFVAGQSVNVDTGAGLETRTIAAVGTAGATGSGITLTAALTQAHAAGAQVNDATINVDIDSSGGNQETVGVASVGTAGGGGTGVTLTSALTKAHVQGAPLANSAAPQIGTTGAIGGVPLVQPPAPGAASGTVCGRVVVPYAGGGGISYISSSDCGDHWSAHTQILPNMVQTHTVAQGLRTSLLPSSSMDGSGAIYLVWQTRSFRVGTVNSTPNDIAMSVMPAPTDASPDPGFAAPARIPIEADNTTANTNDHFIPGIAADPQTSGATAHLGLFYYTYPVAACQFANPGTTSQCNLEVGYVSSTDGGGTWSAPAILAQMTLAEIVRSSQGPMVGDYSNATVIPAGPFQGSAISAFAVGTVGSGADNAMDEAMYVPTHGSAVAGLAISGGAAPIQTASPAAIAQADNAPPEEAPSVPPTLR
jgi:hypothetical protein